MIVVLLIIAILAGVAMPAVQSAFTEQAVRKDGHQLALMVKTAMIQSSEQHRPYVIDLTSTSMALHPEGEAAAVPDDSSSNNNDDDDSIANNSANINVEVTSSIDPDNKLLIPDPVKTDAWIDMPPTEWTFQPGELCPATQIRLKRGDAWLDLTFNPLTGNVDNEGSSFP